MQYYSAATYLSANAGNNALSWQERINKKLFIPSLIQINSLKQVQLGDEVAFEDFDESGNMKSYAGLKNFYELHYKDKIIYIFDNHNHALFFWYLGYHQGLITPGATVIHVDEHADTRVPEEDFSSNKLFDLDCAYQVTNYICNVGNYIAPALQNGLINDILQIRSEYELDDYLQNQRKNLSDNTILNLDLDFFEPRLDFIPEDKKKEVILDAFDKSRLITICTSPYFIDQQRALDKLHYIFGGIL